MTYHIHVAHYAERFAVYAVRDDDNKIVSSCTGCHDLQTAQDRALQYHFSFGRAPIVYAKELQP